MTEKERQEILSIEVESMRGLWERHRRWSIAAFGVNHSLKSILNHIREKCDEIERNPPSMVETDVFVDRALDIMTLAADIALRGGASPSRVAQGLLDLQNRNICRDYPPAGSLPGGTPYRHIPTQSERIEAGELTEEEAIQETERQREKE